MTKKPEMIEGAEGAEESDPAPAEAESPMGRRIFEVYIAAVCLAVTVSILFSTRSFFRSRRAAFQAEGDARVELAGYTAPSSGTRDRAPLNKALERLHDFGLDYESEREYLRFAYIVMGTHVLLLLAAEVIFWRRSRRNRRPNASAFRAPLA